MLSFNELSPADLFILIEMEQVIFPEDPWSAGMLTDELHLADRLYIGAYADGELIGYAGVRVALDTDVMTVGVMPQWRGKGVGSALVKEIMRCLRAVRFAPDGQLLVVEPGAPEPVFGEPGEIARPGRRVERVLLEVRESNQAAISVYARLGFEVAGRLKRYYRNPLEDALLMTLVLPGKSNDWFN